MRTLVWKIASQITLRNFSGEVLFLAVLCLVRTKYIKQVSSTLLQGSKKKQIGTYAASQYGLDTWEGSFIVKRVPAFVSQEERHLIFMFKVDILYFWSMGPLTT